MKSTSSMHKSRHLAAVLSRTILAFSSVLALSSVAAPQIAAGLQKQVIFETYSPLARDTELIDRLFHPLLVEHLRSELASAGPAVREPSIDLAQERFTLYVPAGDMPVGGYGLLVFVMPWDRPAIPSSWLPVLDRRGVICVMAMGSGNSANIFSRRIPLALTSYENIKQRYTVDPDRVYIGGVSGGSRVALRIALAFPDIFRGALLNAGSDSFGTDVLSPPDRALFRQFEEHSRLIYVTGSQDDINLVMDSHSRDSARALCIFDLQTLPMNGRGHELLNAALLDRALAALVSVRTQSADLDACREHRAQEISAHLAKIEQLIVTGNAGEAHKQLQDLDEHFGGLAAPRSIELAHKL